MTTEKEERFEDHIDEETFDALDPYGLEFTSMDEAEVQDLRANCILKEIATIHDTLEIKRDRVKYYGENMTLEDIDLYLSELKRIEKDLA